MEKNVGLVDRVLRVFLAIALVLFTFTNLPLGVRLALFIIGIILFITSITGFCLIYKLLGINTLEKEEGWAKARIKASKVKVKARKIRTARTRAKKKTVRKKAKRKSRRGSRRR